MDIKAAFQNMITSPMRAIGGTKKEVKSESSTDRDADGRREKNEERRKLTEEEKKQLIGHLKALPGIQSNGLIVRIDQRNEVQVLLIETADGRVVRRIPESEFLPILKRQADNKGTGKILDKAM